MLFHPTLFMAKKVSPDAKISRILDENTSTFIENNFSGDLYTNNGMTFFSMKILILFPLTINSSFCDVDNRSWCSRNRT